MKTILFAVLFLTSSVSFAGDEKCTDQPREKWMKAEEMQKKAVEMGYKIKKFKTLEHCYEIYGHDKDGKKVEIYFNPVDGSIFKQK